MKNITISILVIFVLIISCGNGGQNHKNTEVMRYGFITSVEGLNYRQSPNLESTKISLIPYEALAIIVEKTDVKEEIDGIDEYWYRIRYNKKEGFVFGGYIDFKKNDKDELIKKSEKANASFKNLSKFDLFYTHGFVKYFFSEEHLSYKEIIQLFGDPLSCEAKVNDYSLPDGSTMVTAFETIEFKDFVTRFRKEMDPKKSPKNFRFNLNFVKPKKEIIFVEGFKYGILKEDLFNKINLEYLNKENPIKGYINIVEFFLYDENKSFNTKQFSYYYKYVYDDKGTYLIISKKDTRDYIYLKFDKNNKLFECIWDYDVSLWFAV